MYELEYEFEPFDLGEWLYAQEQKHLDPGDDIDEPPYLDEEVQ